MASLQQMNDEGLLNVFAATEGGIDQFLALVTQDSSMLVETSTASTTIRDALSGSVTAEQAGVDFDVSSVDLSVLVPGTGAFPGIESAGRVLPQRWRVLHPEHVRARAAGRRPGGSWSSCSTRPTPRRGCSTAATCPW